MIGMILLATLAVAIFFGITAKFFEKMGVANWVAFLIVLAFAVAAVFPPLIVGTVSFSYAGFFLPLLLSAVLMFAIGINGTLARTVAGVLAIAGIVIATRVAIVPIGNNAATASILIIGFAGGIVSFIIGQNRFAVLASTLGGIVLGDFITAMIFRFVTDTTGYMLQLGQNGIFDTVVLSAIVGCVTLEIVNLISNAFSRHRVVREAVQFEASEDNMFKESDLMLPPNEEDDIYDDYFNDDID